MGDFLQTFTFPRNNIRATANESGTKLMAMLGRVQTKTLERSPSNPTEYKDEQFIDGKGFLGVAEGSYAEPSITLIGEKFLRLAATSPEEAWRWVLVRAMWLWLVPNGTNGRVNGPARQKGISFNFFDMITRLTVRLSALPAPQDILFFDEMLPVLDDDQNWGLSGTDLHDAVLAERAKLGIRDVEAHDGFLGVLEPRYSIPRDNFNKLFTGAFAQTGLFTMIGRPIVGVRLDPGAYERPVYGRRLRFVLDHPLQFSE